MLLSKLSKQALFPTLAREQCDLEVYLSRCRYLDMVFRQMSNLCGIPALLLAMELVGFEDALS